MYLALMKQKRFFHYQNLREDIDLRDLLDAKAVVDSLISSGLSISINEAGYMSIDRYFQLK